MPCNDNTDAADAKSIYDFWEDNTESMLTQLRDIRQEVEENNRALRLLLTKLDARLAQLEEKDG